MGARCTAASNLLEIPTVKQNPWSSVCECCFTHTHKKGKTVNSLCCHFSVSQLWPLSLWGQAHSELQSVISALIFLWRRSVITGWGTTARSPLHLLLTAPWQLNTQVRVFPLVSFWLAGSVRLSCLIPHHVWVVGRALTACCHVVGNVDVRHNKQTHRHRIKA